MSGLVKILPSQNLLDIAVQEYGTIEAVFSIARENGLGITDVLESGTNVKLPSISFIDSYADYYNRKRIQPATADTFDLLQDEPECEGAEFTEEFSYEYNTCLNPEDDGFFNGEFNDEFLT